MAEAQGKFVWYDLLTEDVDASLAFYTDVVGWKISRWEGGSTPYFLLVAGELPVGGVMALESMDAGAAPLWLGYATCDDQDALIGRLEAGGGRVLNAPRAIPDVGRFAVLADPHGAVFASFTPAGSMPLPEPGEVGRVSWPELMTTDPGAAWDFYESLFGWRKAGEMDFGEGGTYQMFGRGEEAEGGIMAIPRVSGQAPHWLHYITVADLEVALAKTRRAGGQVLNGPMPLPGGGAVAQCLDPQGTAFALFAM